VVGVVVVWKSLKVKGGGGGAGSLRKYSSEIWGARVVSASR